MMDVILKRFESPDETRVFEKGKFEIVEIGGICAVHSNFHDRSNQTVGVWFHGRPVGGVLEAGDDLDRVGYFPLRTPPALAFPTDATVIADLTRARGCGHTASVKRQVDWPDQQE